MDLLHALGIDAAAMDALERLGFPSLLLIAVVVVVSFVLLVLVDRLIKPGLDMVWPNLETNAPRLRAWLIRLVSVILGAALVWPVMQTIWGLYIGIICGGCAATFRAVFRIQFERKLGIEVPPSDP